MNNVQLEINRLLDVGTVEAVRQAYVICYKAIINDDAGKPLTPDHTWDSTLARCQDMVRPVIYRDGDASLQLYIDAKSWRINWNGTYKSGDTYTETAQQALALIKASNHRLPAWVLDLLRQNEWSPSAWAIRPS